METTLLTLLAMNADRGDNWLVFSKTEGPHLTGQSFFALVPDFLLTTVTVVVIVLTNL